MHALHTEIIKPKIGPNIMPNTVTKLLQMNRKLHKNFCFLNYNAQFGMRFESMCYESTKEETETTHDCQQL